MTWVNLDDVYVSTNGGTISGDLTVNGTLTCKNGATTYNVGSQLATLGDSVSQIPKKWGYINGCAYGIYGNNDDNRTIQLAFYMPNDQNFYLDINKSGLKLLKGTSGNTTTLWTK